MTTQAATELHGKPKERLTHGGFNLRKWLTNSDELREKIQKCELRDGTKVNDKIKNAKESYAKEILGRKEGTTKKKVLGLSWDCNEDLFIFLIVRTCKKGQQASCFEKKHSENCGRYV